LCFSYYDFANLLDIDVHKGSYIYSSSEPFNEEMAMDHEKIKNWIDLFGFRIYGRLGQAAGGRTSAIHSMPVATYMLKALKK